MNNRESITNKDRSKIIGEKIKNLRISLGYTQPKFGIFIDSKIHGTASASFDKKIVYGWEKGKFLPNKERLQIIAGLANKDVNTFLYGTFGDYIKGLVVFYDKLLTKKRDEEKNLGEFIRTTFSSQIQTDPAKLENFEHFTLESKDYISNQVFQKCVKKKLSYFDNKEICAAFIEVLNESFSNDFRGYTLGIQQSLNEYSDWLSEELTDENIKNDESINAIFELLNETDKKFEKINNHYSKFKTKENNHF